MSSSFIKNSQNRESLNPIIKKEDEKEVFEEEEEFKEIKELIIEEEKEEKRIEIIEQLKFDFHRGRKIVKLCLSKDNLYGKF